MINLFVCSLFQCCDNKVFLTVKIVHFCLHIQLLIQIIVVVVVIPPVPHVPCRHGEHMGNWGLLGVQRTHIRDDVPAQHERHVLRAQMLALVQKGVLGQPALQVQLGPSARADDVVPEDHLVHRRLLLITWALAVLGREEYENLLHVPVEVASEIGAQIEVN
mgnify:CR=1 FL=1